MHFETFALFKNFQITILVILSAETAIFEYPELTYTTLQGLILSTV